MTGYDWHADEEIAAAEARTRRQLADAEARTARHVADVADNLAASVDRLEADARRRGADATAAARFARGVGAGITPGLAARIAGLTTPPDPRPGPTLLATPGGRPVLVYPGEHVDVTTLLPRPETGVTRGATLRRRARW